VARSRRRRKHRHGAHGLGRTLQRLAGNGAFCITNVYNMARQRRKPSAHAPLSLCCGNRAAAYGGFRQPNIATVWRRDRGAGVNSGCPARLTNDSQVVKKNFVCRKGGEVSANLNPNLYSEG